MKRHLSALLVAAAMSTSCAHAATIHKVKVDREGGRYHIVSLFTIHAPIEFVFQVLANYDEFERLSSMFEESHFIQRDDSGEGVVYTRVRECVLFYCKTIERTETLSLDPPNRIMTVVIPEQSDMLFGKSSWELSDSDEGTDVRYEMTIEPDFWVPPVVGPFAIRRILKKGGTRAAGRTEKYALELAAASARDES